MARPKRPLAQLLLRTSFILLLTVMLAGIFLYPGNIVSIRADWVSDNPGDTITKINYVYLRNETNGTIATFFQASNYAQVNVTLGQTLQCLMVGIDVNSSFNDSVPDVYDFVSMEWSGVYVIITAPNSDTTNLGNLTLMSSMDFGDQVGAVYSIWGLSYQFIQSGTYTIKVVWYGLLG
jgi:hypothetical protein